MVEVPPIGPLNSLLRSSILAFIEASKLACIAASIAPKSELMVGVGCTGGIGETEGGTTGGTRVSELGTTGSGWSEADLGTTLSESLEDVASALGRPRGLPRVALVLTMLENRRRGERSKQV